MSEQWIEDAASTIFQGSHFLMQDDIAAIIQRHYEAAAKCQDCGGEGMIDATTDYVQCPKCHGKGRIVP